MTVYIVIRNWSDWSCVYEQWMNESRWVEIVGVYASKEAAERAADTTLRKPRPYIEVYDEIVEKEVQD